MCEPRSYEAGGKVVSLRWRRMAFGGYRQDPQTVPAPAPFPGKSGSPARLDGGDDEHWFWVSPRKLRARRSAPGATPRRRHAARHPNHWRGRPAGSRCPKRPVAAAAGRYLVHAGLGTAVVEHRPHGEALQQRAPGDVLSQLLDGDAGLDPADVGLAEDELVEGNPAIRSRRSWVATWPWEGLRLVVRDGPAGNPSPGLIGSVTKLLVPPLPLGLCAGWERGCGPEAATTCPAVGPSERTVPRSPGLSVRTGWFRNRDKGDRHPRWWAVALRHDCAQWPALSQPHAIPSYRAADPDRI
jgi:hypothetical protein